MNSPGTSLTTAAEAARRALGAVVDNSLAADSVDEAGAGAALAAAGYGLYQAVFRPAAEQQAQATEVRRWLDKLSAEDAVESLEVVVDGTDPVPWNVQGPTVVRRP